ncbi:superoxide dismutase, Cu-Zn family [Saccharopolyspora kobensis]|uniref:Superoxide dismutase, Cu-Zn family n=1 Tax=Saccharopolyspora kobensis TaxID=146035 RepID=A0A1H6E178_9PSEU|nr:superoxide dismutase family protein [Saccharopolyspora kobensis]SEG90934.1 superoxide dismutase, Cu-Zn family [Saccharopolyspora kobensis]SFD94878.1 superoxide dismutase, Cu-Zn family [Saccharopolyspora kobensis]
MPQQRTRLLSSILGACAAAALVAGCGGQPAEEGTPEEHPPGHEQETPGQEQQTAAAARTTATYGSFTPDAKAVTYDPALVPDGAKVDLASERTNGSTKITVELEGLVPNREYGAHVHTKPCGPTGEDAGPHFQEKADPVKPSVDPAYANPQNEVWLDFHTDAQGKATATTEGNWSFDTRQDAKSFVIHESHTHTEPGKAGTAGGRLACLNAKF